MNVNDELEDTFRLFDRNNQNTIKLKELRFILGNIGNKIKQEDIEQILREEELIDKEEIDFQEFKRLFICFF